MKHKTSIEIKFATILNEIERFVRNNGPNVTEYAEFSNLMNVIGSYRRKGLLNERDITALQQRFGEAMTTDKTLQGQVCIKPHGYPGDFDIIDKIYTNYITSDKNLEKWDQYFQSQTAPKAVRNRKSYFKSILKSHNQDLQVLSVVGGPCRGIIEFLKEKL